MNEQSIPVEITRQDGKLWLEGRWLGLGRSMFLKDKGLFFFEPVSGRVPPPITDEIDVDSLSCVDETEIFFDCQRTWLIIGWGSNRDWLYCYDATELCLCRESIRYAGESYFADAKQAFFLDQDGKFLMVQGAHPETFEAMQLPKKGSYHRETRNYFARDQRAAYCNGKSFSANPDLVQLTNHEDYLVLNGRLIYARFPLLLQENHASCRIPDGRDFYLLADQWGTDGVDLYLRMDKGNSRMGEWNTVKIFPDVAPADFVALGSCYARDARHVYCSLDGRVLSKAHPDSFRLIIDRDGSTAWEEVATDGNRVFFRGRQIKGCKAGAFRHIGASYFGDGERFWWLGGSSPELLADPDAATFCVVDLGDSYGVMDRYSPWDCQRRRSIVDEACLEEWRPYFEAHLELEDFWWQRSQNENADQAAGEVPLAHGFAIIAGRVHYQDHPLLNVDVESFRVLNEGHFADLNGLYASDGSRLLDAEWRMLDARHAAGNGKIIYLADRHWDDKGIRQASAEGFHGDGWGWLWSGSKVYFSGVAKKTIDAGSFVSLGYGYGHDGRQVYRQGRPLNFEIDVATAEALNMDFLRDGRGRLFFGRKKIGKGVDVQHLFFYPGNGFTHDGNRVYFVSPFGLRELPQAEMASFTVSDFRFAHDRHRQYDRRTLILEHFGEDSCPPDLYHD